ncbi:MAG: dual specificity protein phosphatase family protein [Myxococcales bacterium]
MREALDLSWVTSELAVGGRFPMERAGELLRELGIARVVDVRGECCDDEEVLRRNGLEFLNLPTQDRCAVSQKMLDDGVAWVREQLRAGHKTFIHCEYGIGRSALLALCVLADSGVGALEALRMLKNARWKVSPSPEQLEGFRAWLARHAMHAPPLDALFHIAYAHLRQGETGTGTAG